MPGSKLVNAGCLASTELPILPFLAPRVFAQWPVSTSARRWNTAGSGGRGRGGSQREECARSQKICQAAEEKGAFSGQRQFSGDVDKTASTGRRPNNYQESRSDPTAYTRPNASTVSTPSLQSPVTQRGRAATRPFMQSAPRVAPQYSQISSFIRNRFCKHYTAAHSAESLPEPTGASSEGYLKDDRDTSQACHDGPQREKEQPLVIRRPTVHVGASLARARARKGLKHPDRSRGPQNRKALPPEKSLHARQWRSRWRPMYYPETRRERRRALARELKDENERSWHMLQTGPTLEVHERNPGFARMKPLAPGFDDMWTAGMAQLRNLLPDQPPSDTEELSVTGEAVDMGSLKKLFAEPTTDEDTLRHAWAGLHPDLRLSMWPRLMLWMLRNCAPEVTCRALMVTHQEPYPPIYAVADTLEFLTTQYAEDRGKYSEAVLEALLNAFHKLLEEVHEFRVVVPHNLIYRLLLHSSTEQTLKLHEWLLENDVSLNWTSYLLLGRSLGKLGDYQRALDMLQQAVVVGADVDSKHFLGTCTTILRGSVAQESGYHANTHIVSRFLDMGVKLDVFHYSVLMFNAVEAGDLPTALRIFDLLQENNVEPNSYIYQALLKGCMTSDDSKTVNAILRSCGQNIRALKNPYLTTNLLYCHYLQLVARSTPRLFATLVDICASLFDVRPLVDLGLLSHSYLTKPSLDKPRTTIPSSTPALGLMILASLRHPEKRSPGSDLRLYLSYRRLVAQGHSDIAPLAESDHTANAFLMAFAQHADTLSYCPRLIKDMTVPLPTSAVHAREGNRPIVPATPTTQTWTILLNGFMRHRQVEAAEKVLQLMRKRGAQPNQVTWNVLVAGYAGMQDVEGAVRALRRMEGEGVGVDDYTVAALGHLRDKQRVARALRKGEEMGDGGVERALEESGRQAADAEAKAVAPETEELPHEVHVAPAAA